MRISDWSSDVCSSDLAALHRGEPDRLDAVPARREPDLRRHRHPQHGRAGRADPDSAGEHAFAAARRRRDPGHRLPGQDRSEEHTSELQSLMRISYAFVCLKKNKITPTKLTQL